MLATDIEDFEFHAKELISDALRLSRENDASLELPLPEGSFHSILKWAVEGFVIMTKILIFAFHHVAEDI